jgi:2-methylaconitate cis-trans-isomerase PrpF
MTGALFPTGRRTDTITVKERNGTCFSVKATLIDAANPFVLVDASTLPAYLQSATKDSTGYLDHMESIRRVGAVAMGLASSTEAAAKVRGTPKLALLSPSGLESAQADEETSIKVLAFSMGKPHPSLQLTGAACLAAAVCIQGTVAHALASEDKLLPRVLASRLSSTESLSPSSTPSRYPSPESNVSEDGASITSTPPSELAPEERKVRIVHASGGIEVGVVAACSDEWAVVDRCSVSRTARRLFDGVVYYYA